MVEILLRGLDPALERNNKGFVIVGFYCLLCDVIVITLFYAKGGRKVKGRMTGWFLRVSRGF